MRYSLLALAATTLLSGVSARGHAHRRHDHSDRHTELMSSTSDGCGCSTYVTSYLVDYTPAIPQPVANATKTVMTVKTVVPIPEVGAKNSISSPYGAPSYGAPSYSAPSSSAPSSSKENTTTIFSTLRATYTSTSLAIVTMHSSSSAPPSVSVPPSTPAGPVPAPAMTTIATPGVYTIPATTITLTETEYVCVPATTMLPPGPQTYGGVTTIVETSTTVICPLATVKVQNGVTTSVIYTTTYVCPSAGTYTIGATTSTVVGTATVPCEYPVPTAYPPGVYTQPEVVVTVTVTSQVFTCPLFAAGPTSTPITATTSVAVPAVVPTSTTIPAPVVAPTTSTTSAAVAPTTSTTSAAVAPTTSTTSAAVAPTTSTTSAVVAPTTSTTSAAVAPTTSTTSAVVVPTSAPVATSSTMPVVASPISSTSAAPAQSSPPPAKVGSSGSPWAITYSPYSNSGGCKTADEIEIDIASIASKGFQNIRIYSTDCSGLQNVGGSAEKHGLGLILGIFLKAGGVSTGDSQVHDILAWAKWDQVVLVVVGNEAIFNGYCTAEELAGYIVSISGQFKSAGYNGPFTTTEPLNTLQQYGSTLCSAVTVTGVNIHPFFNSATSADQAGTFLASEYALAEQICPGKKVWVLESGWPSAGQPNGMAVPGISEQAAAIKGMLAALPGAVAYFTWTNDEWKAAGAYGVEQNFGCGQLFTS